MPPRRGAAAKKRAMGGPIAIMVRKRTICSVMMKGSSTWLDAAMIATSHAAGARREIGLSGHRFRASRRETPLSTGRRLTAPAATQSMFLLAGGMQASGYMFERRSMAAERLPKYGQCPYTQDSCARRFQRGGAEPQGHRAQRQDRSGQRRFCSG